jgi:hypothetical protein
MSDLAITMLVLALLLFGYFVHIYGMRYIHLRADAVTSGVFGGVQISLEERKFMLFNQVYPLVFGHPVMLGLSAIAFVLIGGNAGDESVRGLAYGCALLAAGGAGGALVLGGIHVLRMASRLRRAEAD